MKTLLLSFTLFLALAASPLFAQDWAGAWQTSSNVDIGKLSCQLLVEISKGDDGTWKVVLRNVTWYGRPNVASPVSLQGTKLKFYIPAMGGEYEGRIGADGSAITGKWTEYGRTQPMNLVRRTPENAFTLPERPKAPPPMTEPNPAFDVATVKLSDPKAKINFRYMRLMKDRFMSGNMPLTDLIEWAYWLNSHQLVGGPAWMASEKYDNVGQPNGEGVPSEEQWKEMVRKLMADRFQLKFHTEKREMPVYLLVLAKTELRIAPTNNEGPNPVPNFIYGSPGGVAMDPRYCTMNDFARMLQSWFVDRPIIDRTGITGRHDFQVWWTPDQTVSAAMGPRPEPPPDEVQAPDLFTALQQQVGLKLESAKQPADVIVIDHVERPSEN
jgi:uncharacterized protein (TIGR03435 family)